MRDVTFKEGNGVALEAGGQGSHHEVGGHLCINHQGCGLPPLTPCHACTTHSRSIQDVTQICHRQTSSSACLQDPSFSMLIARSCCCSSWYPLVPFAVWPSAAADVLIVQVARRVHCRNIARFAVLRSTALDPAPGTAATWSACSGCILAAFVRLACMFDGHYCGHLVSALQGIRCYLAKQICHSRQL